MGKQSKPRSPIHQAMDAVIKCTLCGAGMGKCKCWAQCECGWFYQTDGGPCCNPVHRQIRGGKL
jgi:hypothetical protein